MVVEFEGGVGFSRVVVVILVGGHDCFRGELLFSWAVVAVSVWWGGVGVGGHVLCVVVVMGQHVVLVVSCVGDEEGCGNVWAKFPLAEFPNVLSCKAMSWLVSRA